MSDPVILDLHEADHATVADIWFRAWHSAFPDLSHPMPYEAWLPRLRDRIAVECRCRILVFRGIVVGFIAVDVAKACLEQIFVAPEHQNAGRGKLLIKEAKRLSPAGLSLTTLQRNAKAAAFYQREGFTVGRAGINPINGFASMEYIWLPDGRPKQMELPTKLVQ